MELLVRLFCFDGCLSLFKVLLKEEGALLSLSSLVDTLPEPDLRTFGFSWEN